jgi:membrane-associated phospholipid phosphatase
MADQLLQFDRHLFYLINHGLANPFFDWIMPWIRTPKTWIPLFIFLAIFLVWKFKKTGLMIIVLMALSAGFADFTGASLIKPAVKRLRPCQDPVFAQTVVLRKADGCGTGYSFPSSHATNYSAVAFFAIMLFYKRWRWVWFWGTLWAGSICFAQVYVGVHYPIDVFCGALYGCLAGWLFALLFWKLQPILAAKTGECLL